MSHTYLPLPVKKVGFKIMTGKLCLDIKTNPERQITVFTSHANLQSRDLANQHSIRLAPPTRNHLTLGHHTHTSSWLQPFT